MCLDCPHECVCGGVGLDLHTKPWWHYHYRWFIFFNWLFFGGTIFFIFFLVPGVVVIMMVFIFLVVADINVEMDHLSLCGQDDDHHNTIIIIIISLEGKRSSVKIFFWIVFFTFSMCFNYEFYWTPFFAIHWEFSIINR